MPQLWCSGVHFLYCNAATFSAHLLIKCNSCAVQCRVHTRAAAKPLGVLSLSLQNCPEAAVPSHTPSRSAPDQDAAERGGNAATAPLSPFGAAVKEAVASLVPACAALPLTVNMVRGARRSCIQSERGVRGFVGLNTGFSVKRSHVRLCKGANGSKKLVLLVEVASCCLCIYACACVFAKVSLACTAADPVFGIAVRSKSVDQSNTKCSQQAYRECILEFCNHHKLVGCGCVQLNSGTLRPHMDSNDCLVTAPLQMAAHTQLLLDATLMQADQLNTLGCTNYEVNPLD